MQVVARTSMVAIAAALMILGVAVGGHAQAGWSGDLLKVSDAVPAASHCYADVEADGQGDAVTYHTVERCD